MLRIKLFLLKSMLHILISKYGIEMINNQLAEIYYDKAFELRDSFYDDVSEAYDKITEMFRWKHKA